MSQSQKTKKTKKPSKNQKASEIAVGGPSQTTAVATKRTQTRKAASDPGNDDNGPVVCQRFSEQVNLTVTGTSTLSVVSLSINPADNSQFPRLSNIADLFTKWRFKWFRVTWNPLGGLFAAGNQTGEVCLLCSDDWYASTPNSMSIARSRRPSVVGDAWTQRVLNLGKNSKILRGWRYIRNQVGMQGGDARLFDFMFYMVLSGFPSGSNPAGYLTFDGEAEFILDFTPTSLAPNINRAFAGGSTASQTGIVSGVATPIQSAFVVLPNSLQSGAFMTGGSGSNVNLTLYPGSYKVTVSIECTGTTMTTIALNLFPTGTTAFTSMMGGGVTQIGGSTFSVSSFGIDQVAFVTVPENQEAGITVRLADVTVIGTGPVAITNWAVFVEAY